MSHCPRFFIDQVNMVKGFIPDRCKIISFYVPYFCESAEKDKRVLYRKGFEFDVKDGEVRLEHPRVTDEASRVYELDVVPERFFHFLKAFG